MMIKRNIWLSVLLAAIMVFAPVAFAGCEDNTDDGGKKPDDGGKKPTGNDTAWAIAQFDGEEGGELNGTNPGDLTVKDAGKYTRFLKLSFEVDPGYVDASKINISGAAEHAFKPDMLNGGIAPDTQDAVTGEPVMNSGITKDPQSQGGDYLIPVFANYTGEATFEFEYKSNKTSKTVNVIGKYVLPDKNGQPLNYKGKPASYTGTTFVDATYPKTSDLLPYRIDEETGEKILDKTLASAYNLNYVPPYAPDKPEGQKIPGYVLPAYYDNGGAEVAYSSKGAKANPQGNANHGKQPYPSNYRKGSKVPVTSYLKGFYYIGANEDGRLARDNGDIVDFGLYSRIFLKEEWMNMLYCGWTDGGQWWRSTVDVEEDGLYEVRALYSMQNGGDIRFSLDFDPESADVSGVAPDAIFDLCRGPTTNTSADKTGWRQAHHWNKCVVGYMNLKKGQSVLTTRLITGGPNMCHFEFIKIG